ncbi:MAG: UDP-N-acetylmuramoyl-L-alanyl-D-glutamate--2,6-diaminopimelate ligase [Succinivibrio sp.]|nr:UDP-N-acetylmuramoyl-L-alanyl-D-glutamate--2,6-diaminopimelate ligase [Succinivibrio sp.]
MHTLKELYKFVQKAKPLEQDREIVDLEQDSRKIESGMVFVALKGAHVNGLDYLKEVQDKGAVAVVVEDSNRPDPELCAALTIPVLVLKKSLSIAALACWFYDNPSHKLGLIGVTGTNGKSTVTWLVAQWLELMGKKCAVLGTLGCGFLPHLVKTPNTTLNALSLQRKLHEFLAQGARYAVMEVSSIGVDQGRVDGCRFIAGAFTNLTRDHLDYHGTMDNYAQAKEKFLGMVNNSILALNVDDEWGRKLFATFNRAMIYSSDPDFYKSNLFAGAYLNVRHITYRKEGMMLEVESSTGKGQCNLNLLGHFNAANFACALCLMLINKFSLDKLLESAERLKPVTGRMECFKGRNTPYVVVDYAHTPDGVEQVLRGVREHFKDGRVWCVLGCGGDRDHGKRPIMAIKAAVFADQAIFTSDNPRSEDPQAILRDMEAGVAMASNVISIEDRAKAIRYAFEHAAENDCVVIAGKGHEDYQIFKDHTVHFSDRELAAELCGVKLEDETE